MSATWPKWYRPPGARGRSSTRRAFLGGSAAAVTLPALASLAPRSAAASSPPVRLVFWFAPNGVIMSQFRPTDEGPLPETLPRILQPLAHVREDLLVLSGLSNRTPEVSTGGEHPTGTASFLTCAPIGPPTAAPSTGVSADVLAAEALAGLTPLPSLELGVAQPTSLGECFGGFHCAYLQNVSWREGGTPNPRLTEPTAVFDRLFAGFDPTRDAEETALRRLWRASVLDTVLDDARDLRRHLSSEDRLGLEAYLDGIRALEIRIEDPGTSCRSGPAPERGLDYPAACRAMSDLTVLALRCDLTRVVTFMLDDGGSFRSMSFLGIPEQHHELSHHRGDAARIDKLARIETWEMGEFAALIEGLRSVTEPDGTTLLDQTLCFLSSEFSDGNVHSHDDLPVLLAGRGGGYVERPGRHKAFAGAPPLADLYLAMLEAIGVPPHPFGLEGSAPLDLS